MRKKADLRDYQQRTVTKLYESDSVQAVLSMGAGKTAAALTAIRELLDDGVIRCALVIAPKKVAQLVWPAETQEWEHLANLRTVYVRGDEAERTAALSAPADVYTIGLNHIPWLVAWLKKLPDNHPLFDCLVIDESSKLKAPRGTWGYKLTSICRRWGIKWWLTGTPRPNGYVDQFRPLAILSGGKVWGTMLYDRWREKHFEKQDYMGFNWTVRQEHEARLVAKIASLSFTIDPSEMPELPELVTVPHWVDLPPKARKVYDEMERHLLAEVGGDVTVLAANAGVMTGKLEQIANGFLYGNDGTVTGLHDAKSDDMLRLVEELNGDPALLVYQFIEDLNVMREQWGPAFPYMGDDTSDDDAARFEKAWNRRELPLMGMHPGSAAHGLNLQHGGNQVIWYGMTWSAELFDQLVKRIHRPGQKERCFNHLILARGTVDEVKYDRVVRKMDDQDAFKRYLKRI